MTAGQGKLQSRMGARRLWPLAVVAAGWAGTAAAVPTAASEQLKTQVQDFFVGGEYRKVLDHGRSYRNRYGADLQVDFMIGSAACRIRDQRAGGRSYLGELPRRYELKPHQRRIVGIVVRDCTRPWDNPLLVYYGEFPAHEFWIGTAGAGWSTGKAEMIASDGTDLEAILAAAGGGHRDLDEILRDELAPRESPEVAP